MRIGIIADVLDNQNAGIYTYLRGLLDNLYKIDTDNHYILIRSSHHKEYPKWNEICVPLHRLVPFHLRLRQLTSIPKELIKQKVDVVFEPAHFGPYNLPDHIKRITMIHDLTPILFPQYHDWISTIIHKLVLRKTLTNADALIVNSQNTRNDVIAYHSETKSKISILYPGSNGKTEKVSNKDILSKYTIKNEYILFVGTREPRKNLVTLVRTFEKIYATNNKIDLVIVGKKGWKNTELEKTISTSPAKENIIQTGYVNDIDLPTLYSMATLFVYPSSYEGFGLPILEAMKYGAPVVVAKNSSLPEVGGEAAEYFTTEEELHQVLLDLINDKPKLEQMRIQGLRQANKFDWRSTASKFLKIVNNLG
jgi:glycosyltransferase involved in cell wall biosynthesis